MAGHVATRSLYRCVLYINEDSSIDSEDSFISKMMLLVQNGELWRGDIPSVSVENYPWLGREVAWNYAMTRQT